MYLIQSKSKFMMQTKEKHNNHSFSIVVVFYNEKLYIERTLVSWLNQTRQPDQIICVDNGSTDGSIRIAKQILEGSRHIKKVFLSEPKPGKIHALEAGCRAVTSEFVALSDADTYYPPHYLEMCEALFSGSDEKLSALMAQEVKENRTDTKQILKLLQGDNSKGLVTEVALQGASLKKVWWWVGGISLAILGAASIIIKGSF